MLINYADETVFTVGTGLTTSRPGAGRASRSLGSKMPLCKLVHGTFVFDSSYPTGGEDISDLWTQFRGSVLVGVLVDQPLTGAQTGKFVKIDKPTKKILLYTNASPAVEVANASDQSAITSLDFMAWGLL